MGDPVAVLVDDISKSFGEVRAVAGMSWSAAAGQVTAVLGRNGAGKTTTLECLEGLQRPDSGTVRVLGEDPWGASAEHRARVGVMLQDEGLPRGVTGPALLKHLGRLYGNPRTDIAERLELGAFARTPIRRLSGGQRRRVSLAAALVGRPEVAFLDEPAAGLDPHARLDVWELVEDLRDEGVAVVMTTHSFEEAERLADRIVIVEAGHVVADGTPDQVGGERGLEETFFSLTRPDRRPSHAAHPGAQRRRGHSRVEGSPLDDLEDTQVTDTHRTEAQR